MNDEVDLMPALEMSPMSPLSVIADVRDLLEHFDGDEAEVFEFLGKLRDLFA